MHNPQRDYHFVNLRYNLLESKKEKGERVRGREKKERSHREAMKWGFAGGVHCDS